MLKMTTECYEKMMVISTISGKMGDEITSYILSKAVDGHHVIYDLFIPEQEVDATSVDNTEWFDSIPKKDRINYHGFHHVHPGMSLFWSAADDASIKSLLTDHENFLISIVTNEKHEMKVRVDVKIPTPMTADNVKIEIIPRSKIMEQIAKEVESKVKKKTNMMQPIETGWGGHFPYNTVPSSVLPQQTLSKNQIKQYSKEKEVKEISYSDQLGRYMIEYHDNTFEYVLPDDLGPEHLELGKDIDEKKKNN